MLFAAAAAAAVLRLKHEKRCKIAAHLQIFTPDTQTHERTG